MTVGAFLIALLIAATSRNGIPRINLSDLSYFAMLLASDWEKAVDALVLDEDIIHLGPGLAARLSFLHKIQGVAEDVHAAPCSTRRNHCSVFIVNETGSGTSDQREENDVVFFALEPVNCSDGPLLGGVEVEEDLVSSELFEKQVDLTLVVGQESDGRWSHVVHHQVSHIPNHHVGLSGVREGKVVRALRLGPLMMKPEEILPTHAWDWWSNRGIGDRVVVLQFWIEGIDHFSNGGNHSTLHA
jgi:hypothetical protein